MWPSPKEVAGCFCGRARCFCGFYTVDIRPSHLRWTGSPAHISVARLISKSDFYHQQACSYISGHVHCVFTSRIFSCCFSSLIWYYLWAHWWRGKGYLLLPVLHQSVWRLMAGSSTAVLEYIKSRKHPWKCENSVGRHISDERRKPA